MTQLEFFTEVVKKIWEGMSTITVPFLNISVTNLFLGVFVASFAVMILRPILGLGGSAFGAIGSSVHGAISRSRSRSYSERHPRKVEHVHYFGGKKE